MIRTDQPYVPGDRPVRTSGPAEPPPLPEAPSGTLADGTYTGRQAQVGSGPAVNVLVGVPTVVGRDPMVASNASRQQGEVVSDGMVDWYRDLPGKHVSHIAYGDDTMVPMDPSHAGGPGPGFYPLVDADGRPANIFLAGDGRAPLSVAPEGSIVPPPAVLLQDAGVSTSLQAALAAPPGPVGPGVMQTLGDFVRFSHRVELEEPQVYTDAFARARAANLRDSGLVQLRHPELPTVIVPDLHARRQRLAATLAQPVQLDGETVTLFDAVLEGRVNLVFVGDLPHAEARQTEVPGEFGNTFVRWQRGQDAYAAAQGMDRLPDTPDGKVWYTPEAGRPQLEPYRGDDPIIHPERLTESQALRDEMVEGLGVEKMVDDLKALSPDYVYIDRGNHDQVLGIAERDAEGSRGHDFKKLAVGQDHRVLVRDPDGRPLLLPYDPDTPPVDESGRPCTPLLDAEEKPVHLPIGGESDIAREYLIHQFGPGFVAALADDEQSRHLMVLGEGFGVTHSAFETPVTADSLHRRTLSAFDAVAWGDNKKWTDDNRAQHEADFRRSLQAVGLDPQTGRDFGGHRKVLEGDVHRQIMNPDGQEQFVQIDNPRDFVCVVVQPGGTYRPLVNPGQDQPPLVL